MSQETATSTDKPTTPNGPDFEAIEQSIQEQGPNAAIDALVSEFTRRNEPRALLDALLLQARHELGLPAVLEGSLAEMPEPSRTSYEDRYIEAVRRVGKSLLESGDLVAAWPYFRAIGEKEPIAEAIDAYEAVEGDDQIGQVVEIAFNAGANPKRGFELILEHYGACSSITAFDHLPPEDAVRSHCASLLIRHLRESLLVNLRADIEHRGQPVPPEGASIPEVLEGRSWLFDDEGYHIDVSHLASVVRMALLVGDLESIRLAIELTDYGRRLSDRHRYEGEPPFEQTYEDYAIYLRAQLGESVDEAIQHFRDKLPPVDPDGDGDTVAAQVLVRLLVRLERFDEAIDVAAEHLAGLPEASLLCPSLPQLCRRAGRLDRLAEIARDRGDLVSFLAARLDLQGSETSLSREASEQKNGEPSTR